MLHRVSRGIYSLSEIDQIEYKPQINRSLKNLFGKVRNQFPYIDTCLWSTKWLSEFMLHQPGRFFTILEIEKDAMEAVFHYLNSQGREVFLNPSVEILNNYVVNAKSPIIIVSLKTESPILQIENTVTTSLEKMLVDIYCEPELFSTFQGAEMKRIYQSSFEKYLINNSKMLRYANRRGKKIEIQELINDIKERQ